MRVAIGEDLGIEPGKRVTGKLVTALRRLGFDTVMLWPVVEAVPMPLSDTDAKAVRGFRFTITDAIWPLNPC